MPEILEQNYRYNANELTFQQDGEPPHHTLAARQYLYEILPDSWIGPRGPVTWPASSPDLSPFNFFCGTRESTNKSKLFYHISKFLSDIFRRKCHTSSDSRINSIKSLPVNFYSSRHAIS